jgi:hypothetical protein
MQVVQKGGGESTVVENLINYDYKLKRFHSQYDDAILYFVFLKYLVEGENVFNVLACLLKTLMTR